MRQATPGPGDDGYFELSEEAMRLALILMDDFSMLVGPDPNAPAELSFRRPGLRTRVFGERKSSPPQPQPGDRPGIPRHKFDAGGGWQVTSAEVAAALREYDISLSLGRRAPAESWWPAWIDYLRRSVPAGGFTVA